MEVIRPVYFAQAYETDEGTLITWKYRPDTEYSGVYITIPGAAEPVFTAFPANRLLLSDGHTGTLLLTAAGTDGERAEAVSVSLPGIHPLCPEDILPVRPDIAICPDPAGAYFLKDGKRFTVNGFNFIGLSGRDHSTFEPFEYDPYTTETMLLQMHALGYNVVRVFIMGGRNEINPGFSGGPDHNDRTFDPVYMGNVLHFLRLCRKYDFYVLPNFGDNEIPGNRYYQTLSGGCDRMQVYFHENAVQAKAVMVEEFLNEIRQADPALLNTLFAVQLQNEFCFGEIFPPFDQHEGIYRLYDGSEYDMADPAARRALANRAAYLYFTKLRETVKAAAPAKLLCEGTFTMAAVGKSMETAFGFDTGLEDYRLPLSGLEYLRMPLDFLDMHVYCEDPDDGEEAFRKNYANMLLNTEETAALLREKPVIMGEFSSFKPNRRTGDFAMAEKTITAIRDAAMAHGFAGMLLWTVDSFWQREIWHLMEDGGGFAARLSLLPPESDTL
ncbi:MAG: hypothetical protein E7631_03500 [Ruminococcaceae bacterium]|nr:hypothetical protein [Oscillospiraceae bacterium]